MEEKLVEEREVVLVGFDIHQFVKDLCDQFLGDSPDMTDGEKKAYKLGIDNTLGFLDQTVTNFIVDGYEECKNIAVHVPGLKNMTEFATIEDILNKGEIQ